MIFVISKIRKCRTFTLGEFLKPLNKTYKITFRVDEKLKEKIKKESQKSKISMSEYIVKQLRGKTITVYEGLNEIVYELRKIGNNLNQIAKNLNSNNSKFRDSQNLIEIKNEVNKIWQLLNSLK